LSRIARTAAVPVAMSVTIAPQTGRATAAGRRREYHANRPNARIASVPQSAGEINGSKVKDILN
jgi:hypothetical protein